MDVHAISWALVLLGWSVWIAARVYRWEKGLRR